MDNLSACPGRTLVADPPVHPIPRRMVYSRASGRGGSRAEGAAALAGDHAVSVPACRRVDSLAPRTRLAPQDQANPMTAVATVPFLTELDPRLKIRGSRDPLGIQAVWATLGRQLVGNLTLVSSDIAGFRTLLIGYGLPGEDAPAAERLRIFLRWEQAAAACRVAANDSAAPLGARRVRRALDAGDALTISEEPRHQILGDQRATGLWVLYNRAARTSGLVTENRRLTAAGRNVVEQWLAQLEAEAASVLTAVRHTRRQELTVMAEGDPTPEAARVAALLVEGTVTDRALLYRHLVQGIVGGASEPARGLADGRQTQLAALISQRSLTAPLAMLVQALRAAAANHDDSGLARRLEHILIVETVLQPANAALGALLQEGHGSTVTAVARRIGDAWPAVGSSVRASEFRAMVAPVLRTALGSQRVRFWTDVAEAAAASRWTDAVHGLLALHEHTMLWRGSAPWVRLDVGDIIDVRLREGSALPSQEELSEGEFNPYYLPPLLSLAGDLQEPA